MDRSHSDETVRSGLEHDHDHDEPMSPISRELSPTLHEFDLEASTPVNEYGPEHVQQAQVALPDAVVAVAPDGAKLTKQHAEELLEDQSNFLPRKQVIIVFLGLSAALACSFLEQTMMSTALPQISAELNSGSSAPWIITSFLLTSTAVTPLSSRFSDIFGRKVVLLFCLAEFGIFSLGCAVAQTTTQMIVFRALAGTGGGCLINLALIIVSDIVSLRDRGKYQGIIEIVGAVSGGVGPLLGGAFAEKNWRYVFWFCVILTAIGMASVWKVLPLKKVPGEIKHKILQIDGVGSCFVLAATILLLVGLNYGGVVYPWISAPVLVTMILGVLLFIGFAVYEAFIPRIPIIPLAIFKVQTVSAVVCMTFFIGAMQYCLLFYIPQWYQVVRGESPLMSGVLILPYICCIGPTVLICAQIVAKTGIYRPMVWAGASTWALGMGLLTTIDRNTPGSRVLGFQALCGLGAGMVFQTSLTAMQAATDRQHVAVATGFRNFSRLLSGTIFIAISSSLINQSITNIGLSAETIQQVLNDPPSIHTSPAFDDNTRNNIIDAYQNGFRTVFYMLTGTGCIVAVTSLLFVKHHSLRRPDDDALKAAGHKFMEERKAKREAKKHAHDHDLETGKHE